MLAGDIDSSLLWKFVIYRCKKFYRIGPSKFIGQLQYLPNMYNITSLGAPHWTPLKAYTPSPCWQIADKDKEHMFYTVRDRL